MGSESPQIADQDRPKPLALDYVSARVPPRFRPRRHGGPGNDW
jgi:hypothetical protein